MGAGTLDHDTMQILVMFVVVAFLLTYHLISIAVERQQSWRITLFTGAGMAKKSSRDHIIATATALFAQRGLSVSLREINEAAGLSAAAVHYHFKNKNALLDAVLRSRLRSRESQQQRLQAALAMPQPDVAALVGVLVAPLSEILLEDPQGGRDYVRVVARLYAEHGEIADYALMDEFREPVAALMDAFSKALPALPASVLRLRYGFALETLVNTLACVNFPSHLSDLGPPEALEAMVAELKRFLAAGFAAPYP